MTKDATGKVMLPFGRLTPLSPDMELEQAEATLHTAGQSQLPVMANGAPLGLLSRDEVARFIRKLQAMRAS